eukprot:s5703_g1.t1
MGSSLSPADYVGWRACCVLRNSMAKRRYEEVDEFQEDAEDAEENAEEDAELEPEQNAAEDGEANEDERYWGFISSVKDDRMWVTCEQVPPEFAHRDPKITRKSKAPAGLELGSWISFDLLDEWPGENWGSLLVINIEPCEPPDDWDKEEALAAVEAKERAARRDRGSKEPRNNKANQWSQAKANGHANGRNGQGRVPPAAQALTSRSQPAAKRPGQAAVPPAGGLSKSSAVAAFREATRAGRAFSSGWSAPKKQATQVSNWKRPRKQEAVPADLAPFEKAFLAAPESLSEEERQSMMESRETLEIRVEMPDELADVFPPISGFDDLRGILPDYAFEGIAAMGIETPMPIQAQALPLALAGLDVVGVAKTGSGKTLAYLLPALTHIEVQEPLQHGVAAPIALILAPTRELAVQIADMSRAVVDSTTGSAHPNGLAAGVLYGGGHGSKGWQVADIRNGAHIVAATPGRLLDVMDSGEVSLERVTYFVLDEADRMLECGFEDQVGRIGKSRHGIVGFQHRKLRRMRRYHWCLFPKHVQGPCSERWCDTVFGPGNRQSHHEWWSQQPLDGIVSSGSLCHCRPRSNSLAPANPPTGEGGDRGCTPSLGGLLSGPWPRQDQQRTEAMEHGDQLEALLFGGLDVACPVVTRSAVPLVLVQVAAAHPAEAPSEAPAGGLLGFLGFLVF